MLFVKILCLVLAVLTCAHSVHTKHDYDAKVRVALVAYSFGCLLLSILLSPGVFK